MARAERIGIAVALAGHALLFGALSLGWLNAPEPPKPTQQPIDVSLVKDVALESAAPVVAPPAPSVAPEKGEPEDAAPPPEESEPEPEPVKAKPAPPKPAPEKPTPVKPAPEKPAPKPQPKPVAKPKAEPAPKPAPAKPKHEKAEPAKAEPKAEAKPAKTSAAKPTPAKATSAKTASAKSSTATAKPAKAKPVANTGSGTNVAAKSKRPHGSRLGDDFLKGIADAPPAKAAPPAAVSAAKIDAHALASIQAAIARQIQPCADRQSDGGIPQDARQVVITFNLRLNADGSLASVPRIVRRQNVDGDNSRYVQQIADIGIAAFKGCSPLKLPAEYYSTAAGGWNNINFNWQLR